MNKISEAFLREARKAVDDRLAATGQVGPVRPSRRAQFRADSPAVTEPPTPIPPAEPKVYTAWSIDPMMTETNRCEAMKVLRDFFNRPSGRIWSRIVFNQQWIQVPQNRIGEFIMKMHKVPGISVQWSPGGGWCPSWGPIYSKRPWIK